MNAAVIAGARPNFVKVAPLLRALHDVGATAKLVHTGQHYDWAMSEALFRDLGIPAPDVNLEVGSASHAVQTARVMVAFDEWLDGADVDQVITVGDVNSTIACAMVATKRGVPVAHVEAGLRSFDRTMPEEINRVLDDSISTWLFTPSADADDNLVAEGVDPTRIHRVGNIMVDSLLASLPKAQESDVLDRLGVTGSFALATLHRPALVDDVDRLGGVLVALSKISDDVPVLFPVHPRTRQRILDAGLEHVAAGVQLCDPVGYLDFVRLESAASLVLTDSGGVQEETTVLGVPCLTLRPNTERPMTITEGTNRLVGLDPADIVAAAEDALTNGAAPRRPALWDGHTAERVAAVLSRGEPAVEWVPPAVREHTR